MSGEVGIRRPPQKGAHAAAIRLDPVPGKRYIAFTDPDRITRELYMA